MGPSLRRRPRRGKFLYTVTSRTSPPNITFQLSSYKIDTSTGALTATSTISWPQSNYWIAVDPASKFLYSPTPPANGFAIYTLDSTTGVPTADGGFLIPTQICGFGCPVPSGPGALAITPDGKFMYYGSSTFGGASQAVGALNIGSATGQLSEVSGSPFFQVPMPFMVLVHPSGKFVYTENINSSVIGGFTLNSVSGFSVDATGALTPVPGSPVPAPATASIVGFAIHPSGKFLYATTGLAANGILAWSVNPTTGALTALPGSPFAPGTALFGGTFDPAGKFFYASAGATGGITGFSVDAITGALTSLSGSPFAAPSFFGGPTVDPSGKFLFALQKNSITTFKLDATTGSLTAQGSPTSVGALPGFLTIVKAP